MTRIPAGHPEGYLEGFASIYSETADLIAAHEAGIEAPSAVALPSIEDGIEGLAFIEACVTSSKDNGAWTKL